MKKVLFLHFLYDQYGPFVESSRLSLEKQMGVIPHIYNIVVDGKIPYFISQINRVLQDASSGVDYFSIISQNDILNLDSTLIHINEMGNTFSISGAYTRTNIWRLNSLKSSIDKANRSVLVADSSHIRHLIENASNSFDPILSATLFSIDIFKEIGKFNEYLFAFHTEYIVRCLVKHKILLINKTLCSSQQHEHMYVDTVGEQEYKQICSKEYSTLMEKYCS